MTRHDSRALLLLPVAALLCLGPACGDKGGDDTPGGDGGTADGGSSDGGSSDGGSSDGGSSDGGSSDGGSSDGGSSDGGATGCPLPLTDPCSKAALAERLEGLRVYEGNALLNGADEIEALCESWDAVDGMLDLRLGSGESDDVEVCLQAVTGSFVASAGGGALEFPELELVCGRMVPHLGDAGHVSLPVLRYVGDDLSMSWEHSATIGEFSALSEVRGEFYLAGRNLVATADPHPGAPCLETVGGLEVYSDDLTEIPPLPRLRVATGDVHIHDSDLLIGIDLPALEEIGGDLTLGYLPSLASLTGLGALTTVSGTLYIYDAPVLTDLSGLEGLLSAGDITIYDAVAITSVDALASLSSVGKLSIYHAPLVEQVDVVEGVTDLGGLYLNDVGILALPQLGTRTALTGDLGLTDLAITDLDALIGLESVGGTLTLSTLPGVDDLGALSGLTEVAGLSISNMDELSDLDALGGIGGALSGSLYVYYSDGLTDLCGLSGITAVDGYVSIHANDSLESICGLASLASVGADLEIRYNDALTDVTALHGVASVGGDVVACDNDSLSPDALEALFAALAPGVGGELSTDGCKR